MERDPEKYGNKKPVEMPPIFDRDISYLDTFKQKRKTVSGVISRLPSVDREVAAGNNLYIGALDVMDLMQNLDGRSQQRLSNRYP